MLTNYIAAADYVMMQW